jgi:hypothetical protein
VADRRIHRDRSLQFDPAPRTGEPLVSRRVPDYFLVKSTPLSVYDELIVFDSKHFARTRVLYIQHDPTTSCILNRPSPIYLSTENLLPSIIEHATEVVAACLFLFYELQKSHMRSAIPFPTTPRHDLSGFLFYLWGTDIVYKDRKKTRC